MATTLSNAQKSKNQRIDAMRDAIAKQDALVKAKNKDYRTYAKRAKQGLKGKDLASQMTVNTVLNAKKQDIFRTKQRLLQLKEGLKAVKKQKVS